MSASLNKVLIIGNLGKDPVVRHTKDGRPIANFSIATSESWKDKTSGERRDKTEWHSVVIFNEGLAKVAERYLRKGSKVYIEGQLQTRKWTDSDGAERYTTEVILTGFGASLVLLDGKNRNASEDNSNANREAGGVEIAAPTPVGRESVVLNDDIPF